MIIVNMMKHVVDLECMFVVMVDAVNHVDDSDRIYMIIVVYGKKMQFLIKKNYQTNPIWKIF